MNDIRRTILWVIFGFSMVLLWDQWQIHNGKQATFFPNPASKAAVAPATAVSASAEVPVAAVTPGQAPVPSPAAAVASERFEVNTDVLKLTFDTQGGALVRTEFLQYLDSNDKTRNFVLLDDTKDRYYQAQTGLIGGAAPDSFPTHKSVMAVSGDKSLKDGQDELKIVFTSQDTGGIKLVKTYTLRRGAYDIAVKHEVINTGATALNPQLYLQLVRDGNKPVGESSFYSTFTGPAVYTDLKKYQKVEFSDIKKGKADFEKESTNGYIAMVQHYFASAWILPPDVKRTFSLDARDVGATVADCCYRATMITPLETVAPGQTKAVEAKLFVGPQEEKKLEALAPGMELVKDYGWLTILAKPLYWLLDKLHGFIQNWGWSIVALVLLLKIAFYWLNAKAYASMAKMKAVNPRIMEMRERLKDNPQQMQQEMMRDLPRGKGQPHGWLLPHHGSDSGFHRLVLGAPVQRGNAQCALGVVDS